MKILSVFISKTKAEIKIDSDIRHKHNFDNMKLVEYQVNENDIDDKLLTFQDDGEKFNQFQINEEKFNVQSSYDESKYTSVINYESLPDHIKAKALKIESELTTQGGINLNKHIQEERGLAKTKDYEDEEDEELMYSSVIRNIKNQSQNPDSFKENNDKSINTANTSYITNSNDSNKNNK